MLKSRYSLETAAKMLGLPEWEAYQLLSKYRIQPNEKGLYPAQAVADILEIRRRTGNVDLQV